MNTALKSVIGPRMTVLARCLLRGLPIARWGNLRRVDPFSSRFGSERGTPVDRFYLHDFLHEHRALITGRVLEVQLPSYTRRYGHDVETSHTVDISPEFAATYTCDLANAPQIPSDSYDCFLAPNTLGHIKSLEPALQTLLRVVKPGGTLLLSTTTLLPLLPDGDDYWRMSPQGWREMLGRHWPGCEIEIQSHGNCVVAIAAMHGLTVEELTEDELRANDPRFPVLITIRCRKP